MKKLLASILTGALVLSTLAMGTAGCSSSAPNASSGSASGANAAEQKSFTVWAWDKNYNIAALTAAADIYKKVKPNVKVNIVEVAQADVYQKLNTGLSSGTMVGLPDMVLIQDDRLQTFLKSYPGNFRDLSDVVKAEDFSKYELDFLTENGKMYGIPFGSGTACLFYRKDYIKQAGYTEKDMTDLTWEKYIEIGKAVKQKTGKDMLTLDPNDLGQVRMMMQSAGGWYLKEDGTTPYFAGNQTLKAALEVYKQLMDAKIVSITSDWGQFVAAPNSGKVATVPTGCWFIPSIAAEASQKGQWGIAAIPRLSTVPTGTNSTKLGGSDFTVLAKAPGADLAADFIKNTFASSSDLYQTILDKNGIIATYKPAMKGEAYQKGSEFFGGQKIFNDLSNWGVKTPAINYGLYTYACEDRDGIQSIRT